MTTHHPTHHTTHASHGGASANSGPWFTATLCLLTFILGFGAAMGLNISSGGSGTTAGTAPTPSAAGGQAAAVPDNFAPATADDDYYLGKADAPVTLIEFSDYQCPFCRKFWKQTYPQLKKDYIDTGKVKFVYRDFPLSFHPLARPMATAAECAKAQSNDLAVAMHDALFEGQESTAQPTKDDVKKWAVAVPGLNVATWTTCYDNETPKDEISKDMKDGQASGVTGTPGFWILGPKDASKRIKGAVPFETFKKEIDAMLGA